MNRKQKSLAAVSAIILITGGCAIHTAQSPIVDHQPQPVAISPTSQAPQRLGVIKSSIVSDFEGFDYGNVYELANGQFWEQTEAWIWIAVQPRVAIITDGVVGKMQVEGIEHSVGVRHIDSAFQSHLASDFDGFSYGNVYELDNGQVWEQTQALIRIRVRTHPKVLIWKIGATYRMKVGDISETVAVKQIK